MKRFVIGIVSALMISGLCYAAAQSLSGVSVVNDVKAQLFKAGIYVGNETNALKSTANKVTVVLEGSETYDYASGTIVCEDSTGITMTGAKVGDPCFVGMPSTFTAGGTGLHHTFSCYVSAADTVKGRACAAGTADNPGSATFRYRVISSQ